MTDADARLAAALGADGPPERDVLFRLEVLARIERAQFRRRIVGTTTIALMASALVVVNAQAIDAWTATDPRHPWIVAAAALGVVLVIPGMPIAATPGVRAVVKAFGRWFTG